MRSAAGDALKACEKKAGKRVGVTLSGGNIDGECYIEVLGGNLTSGRTKSIE